jgi:hypothetical protein
MSALYVLSEVCLEHVASLLESLVECERSLEGVRCVTDALSKLEVVPHELFVEWVNTVFDDAFCALTWVFTAKVGNTLFCNEDLNRVFAVVNV